MNKIKISILSLLFITVFACQKSEKQSDEEVIETEGTSTENVDSALSASALMNPKSGSSVSGNINFEQVGASVMMSLQLSGLEPGTHAVHLHEVGDCSADDATSAGDHWNPTGHAHGEWGKNEFHLGDIGNLEVDEDGNVNMTFTTDKWTLETGQENTIVGKAVIVHEKADDFTSQPSGAAGARISCGVIQ